MVELGGVVVAVAAAAGWVLRSQCIRLANSSLAVELRLQTLRK